MFERRLHEEIKQWIKEFNAEEKLLNNTSFQKHTGQEILTQIAAEGTNTEFTEQQVYN